MSDKEILSDYLRDNVVKKLHLGCGSNIMAGWLNSDLNPNKNNVLHLDASGAFPLPSAIFDYVYSEHMIEHLTYDQGFNMLRESYRVLKPGGKIRISTPSMRFLFELYLSPKKYEGYIKWASDSFVGNGFYSSAMVINNFFRNWGHQFIYDENLIERSLELAGFRYVKFFDITESDDSNLRGLELINRLPADYLKIETMSIEGTKIELL